MLRKIVLGFFLLLLVSIFVTGGKEKHAHDADAYAKKCGGAAIAAVDRPETNKNCGDSQRYTPSWEAAVAYRVFGWPEGITASDGTFLASL